ncbi:hypothetical protein KY285_007846 [Solanum tuberosum]|nr:hypothetical protein KY285_007846 [Solanum tuberosum]
MVMLKTAISSSGKRWRICGIGRRFKPQTMQSEARSCLTFENFRSIDDKATLYLKLWNSPGTFFIFLVSKHSALFDLQAQLIKFRVSLEYLFHKYGTNLKFDGYARVTISYQPQRLQSIEASRLRKLMTEDLISMHMELRESYGLKKSGCPQWMRWEKLELLQGLRASQLVYMNSGGWWLFRKATFASTELEALGCSPDESILQKFWKLCERQLNIPEDCQYEGIGDELIIILKSAIKEVVACALNKLKNLIRLYELHLSRQISIESLLNDLAVTFKNFSTIDDEHSALFQLLESFLTTKSSEGLRASQLACRVVLFLQTSTELEALGYSPD